MAINCVRLCETAEKKYHHNVAITAVFDNIYGHLYFIEKTPQGGTKDAGMLTLMKSEEDKPCH